ncbi:RING-type domain-containing protein [Caenorhabditis elegans]|uniref:RING-type domain-containing protein n=1 Tax=Caenorhabditis elegans TaxID=6239 RepID=O62260_CAEEL|nr:RING-type domain-containing protein [Caenorhabditis elegans]CAB04460.1 RING-type domain-containing protein [Caenorhabditis elegans]|eukprot:NP_507996.1 Uncharacterized protein CELE_F53F8.3 [Caenorhabditis elegans]
MLRRSSRHADQRKNGAQLRAEEEANKVKLRLTAENEKLKSEVEKLKKDHEELSRVTLKVNTEFTIQESHMARLLRENMSLKEQLNDFSFKLRFRDDMSRVEEQVKKEQGVTDGYRRRVNQLTEFHVKSQEEQRGEPFPWRTCEICACKFEGETMDQTPRVLGCGHTMCMGCVQKIVGQGYIKCPFCRIVTKIGTTPLNNLPKNYIVLNM